jgi:hypothetical protein
MCCFAALFLAVANVAPSPKESDGFRCAALSWSYQAAPVLEDEDVCDKVW